MPLSESGFAASTHRWILWNPETECPLAEIYYSDGVKAYEAVLLFLTEEAAIEYRDFYDVAEAMEMVQQCRVREALITMSIFP